MRRFVVLALCTLATCALALWPGAATGAGLGEPVSAAAKKKAKGKAKAKPCRTRARSRCKRGKCARRSSKTRARKRRRCSRKRKAAKRPAPTAWAPRQVARTGSPAFDQPPSAWNPEAPLGRYLSVSVKEYRLQLSRPALAAGSVTVELRNVGEDPHDLVVSPDDGSHSVVTAFPETPPGGLDSRGLQLPAGRYYLFCSIDGHEALGMSALLRVQ